MKSRFIYRSRLFFFPDEHDEKADGQQCAGDPDAPFGHVRRQQRPQSRAYGKQADDTEIGQRLASGITHDKNMITNLFSDENSGIYNEFLSGMAGVINDLFDKKVPFTQCENDKKAECKYCRFIEFCRR